MKISSRRRRFIALGSALDRSRRRSGRLFSIKGAARIRRSDRNSHSRNASMRNETNHITSHHITSHHITSERRYSLTNAARRATSSSLSPSTPTPHRPHRHASHDSHLSVRLRFKPIHREIPRRPRSVTTTRPTRPLQRHLTPQSTLSVNPYARSNISFSSSHASGSDANTSSLSKTTTRRTHQRPDALLELTPLAAPLE